MSILKIIQTIILGIVEGVTEWLPISSTGHMILANEFMGIKDGDFFSSQIFLYIIQLGAILAIVTLYFKRLNPFSIAKGKQGRKETWQMWFKIMVSCIPAIVLGLLFNDEMDKIANYLVVSIMLIVYGIAFIFIERRNKVVRLDNINDITYKTALYIGIFQALSIVPGTSRSGATILGAMIIGCSRALSAEYTFFLSIPVMVGVSMLKIGAYFKDVYIDKIVAPFTPSDWMLLVLGMIVSYIVSLFAVKFLISFVRKHDFKSFGWYRIVLGIVVILYFCLKQFVF